MKLHPIFHNLTIQVILGILLGILVGITAPTFAAQLKPLADGFIRLIKMSIAPIVFMTIVTGIGKINTIQKLGRIGGKALLYFEIVTTFALFIGVAVANLIKPGKGINLDTIKAQDISQYTNSAEKTTGVDFVLHILPENIIDSFAKGEMLQILFFAVLFGIAVNAIGEKAKPAITFFDSLLLILFRILEMIMKLAPIGAFGGMAFTIGKYGLAMLLPLFKLMFSVYITMLLFIFVILNTICWYYGFSLWKLLKFIKAEILIVLGTSSSESVLPAIIKRLEAFGCSPSIVGLTIPTGYSFNLDGTTIYLSMAVIFLAQVTNTPLTISQELYIIFILMITSKGAAGVTGSGFIVLASTLAALNTIPVASIGILLGVDRFMSEARSITNLIGNCVATVVIAKSENEFDEKAYLNSSILEEEEGI